MKIKNFCLAAGPGGKAKNQETYPQIRKIGKIPIRTSGKDGRERVIVGPLEKVPKDFFNWADDSIP